VRTTIIEWGAGHATRRLHFGPQHYLQSALVEDVCTVLLELLSSNPHALKGTQ
jgi:hypothetical protein